MSSQGLSLSSNGFVLLFLGFLRVWRGEGGGGRRGEGGRREPFSLNEFPYARTTTGDCLLVVACAGTAAAPQCCWPGSVLNFALIMRCARFTQLWHTSDYVPKLTNMVFCVILCLRDHSFPRRSFPGTWPNFGQKCGYLPFSNDALVCVSVFERPLCL